MTDEEIRAVAQIINGNATASEKEVAHRLNRALVKRFPEHKKAVAKQWNVDFPYEDFLLTHEEFHS